jgi:hypothetical protein
MVGSTFVRGANLRGLHDPRFISGSVTVNPFYYPPVFQQGKGSNAARRCSICRFQKRRGIDRCSPTARALERRGRRGRLPTQLLRRLVPPATRSRSGRRRHVRREDAHCSGSTRPGDYCCPVTLIQFRRSQRSYSFGAPNIEHSGLRASCRDAHTVHLRWIGR